MLEAILKTAWEEWSRLVRNPRDLVVMVGGPILFMLLFGFLYFYNVVTDIDTVVWDQDNTSLSRSVVSGFGDSDRFTIIGTVGSQDELKQMLDSGKAKVALVIPRNFLRDVKKQHPTQLLICVDGTNLVISNSVMTSALEIVQTFSAGAGIKMIEGQGSLPDKAQNLILPISFRPRIWYNPTFNYSNFLLPGLMGVAVQQMVLLYSSVSIVRDKRQGTIPVKGIKEITAYTIGKGLPYLMINVINLNVILVMLIALFAVPFRGNPLLLFSLEFVFVGGLVALGLFISIACRNELEATQLSMIIAVPSFLVSGYTWPLFAMPLPVQMLAKALPLTYFVSVFRDLALKPIGLTIMFPSLLYLSGLMVIFFPLGVYLLYKQAAKALPGPQVDHSLNPAR